MNYQILIIENDHSLRQEIAEILGSAGYGVLQAPTGRAGIELALKHAPGLILCDMMIQEMDGNSILEAVREQPNNALTPFVMITSNEERRHLRSILSTGADDYIIKPFKKEELINIIKARLKRSEALKAHTESSIDELRSKLIRSLPHELRTPLNGIIGFGQLLQSKADNYTHEEIAEMGNHIYESGMRLYRLIQNYLLYAQLEMKKEAVFPKKIAYKKAHEACKNVAEQMAEKHGRGKDLTLHLECATAYIGMQEFKKVVEELTDNAFKFSQPDSEVAVVCGGEKDVFYLAVSDSGRGMNKHDIPRIGAYMQFDRHEYEQQGSGLGLILCKRITDLYDGTLTIESKAGQGTLVRVVLPGQSNK